MRLVSITVNKAVMILRDPSSAAAMMATPCRVMGLTVPMMMSVLWEHTTVSSCVSTLPGDSGVSVCQDINSTLTEYTVQVQFIPIPFMMAYYLLN